MPFRIHHFLQKVFNVPVKKEEPKPEPVNVPDPEPEPIQEIVIPTYERDSDEELEMDMGVIVRKRPSNARLLRKIALNPLSERKSEDPEVVVLQDFGH